MHGAVLSLRCLLALVFAVAAAGKLLDLTGSRRALEEFGVPEGVARLGGVALPLAELAVAIALVLRPSARWGAVGACVLLMAFVAGVGRAMAQGRAPDCHCFGQIHSEPAGPSTLIRNAVLAAMAVFVIAAGPGPSLNGALSGLNASQAGLVGVSAAAVLLALSLLQLWSDRSRLKRELAVAIAARSPAGLPRGMQAPEFALTPVRGSAGSLGELLEGGRQAVLVFVSTSCGPCQALMPSLARWQETLSESLAVAAIFSGEQAEIERQSDAHGFTLAMAQEDDETFRTYALRGTPSAVLVDSEGVIAGAPAEGAPAIESLVRITVARSGPAQLLVHHG